MSTPAGWYDDGSGCRRWWNGQAWTEDVWDERPSRSDVMRLTQRRDQTAVVSAQISAKPSVLDRLGSSVVKAVTDRRAEKEERRRAPPTVGCPSDVLREGSWPASGDAGADV